MSTEHIDSAVLFIGHGTRSEAGLNDCRAFADGVIERVRSHVAFCSDCGSPPPMALAFLELARPTLEEALADLWKTGVRQATLVPLFLFEAGHMKEDIPRILQACHTERPPFFCMLSPFGEEQSFMQAAVDRIAKEQTGNAGDAILLLGRGNRDEKAQQVFQTVANSVQSAYPDIPVTTGFLAGSGRDWQDALDVLYRSGSRDIVLQPYLWFRGWLTEQLSRWVDAWVQTHPDSKVRIAGHLGVDAAMMDTVAQRVISSQHTANGRVV